MSLRYTAGPFPILSSSMFWMKKWIPMAVCPYYLQLLAGSHRHHKCPTWCSLQHQASSSWAPLSRVVETYCELPQRLGVGSQSISGACCLSFRWTVPGKPKEIWFVGRYQFQVCHQSSCLGLGFNVGNSVITLPAGGVALDQASAWYLNSNGCLGGEKKLSLSNAWRCLDHNQIWLGKALLMSCWVPSWPAWLLSRLM